MLALGESRELGQPGVLRSAGPLVLVTFEQGLHLWSSGPERSLLASWSLSTIYEDLIENDETGDGVSPGTVRLVSGAFSESLDYIALLTSNNRYVVLSLVLSIMAVSPFFQPGTS